MRMFVGFMTIWEETITSERQEWYFGSKTPTKKEKKIMSYVSCYYIWYQTTYQKKVVQKDSSLSSLFRSFSGQFLISPILWTGPFSLQRYFKHTPTRVSDKKNKAEKFLTCLRPENLLKFKFGHCIHCAMDGILSRGSANAISRIQMTN